jgi:hypothetical protein
MLPGVLLIYMNSNRLVVPAKCQGGSGILPWRWRESTHQAPLAYGADGCVTLLLREAVSGWPLQRIHALRAIRTFPVQQRLAVS